MPLALRLCLLATLGLLPACALLRKPPPWKPVPRAERVRGAHPQRVGVIALVNAESGFVVIDTGTLPVPASGTALRVFGDGVETAVLAVGDISRRPMVVAEVVKGLPRKGDVVFR
jgi:hypothetical protein